MRGLVLLWSLPMLALAACAGTQRLGVLTEPPGAEVTLIKIGVRQARGTLGELTGMAQMQSTFEDPPIVLGTSPLEVEFELSEAQASIYLPGAQAEVTKETLAGILRATKAGLVAEQRVQFTGEPLEVFLELTAPDPAGEP